MIPKPEGTQWTDDQWKAIAANGQDILVAAAAGSGKTAVLVERIIKKITSNENPIDVDSLLVVTFTNASAQEMKMRISEALEKELMMNSASSHLRKQLSLIGRASISTIHSFCLEVIRTYYYLLDIDPGFRIGNETEIQLLQEETLEEILEDEYGTPDNELFFDLVDCYTGDRSDTDLQEMILKLYTEARAHPNPEQWLDGLVELYHTEGKTIDDLPYKKPLMDDVMLRLETARYSLEKAIVLTNQPNGPVPRLETFEADKMQLDNLISAANTSWQALYEAMQNVSFSSLKRIKKEAYDEDLVEQTQKLRDKQKEIIKNLQEELFTRTPQRYLADLTLMHPLLRKLTNIVKLFAIRFQEVKRDKGLVDFTDLEHLCLEVLRDASAKGSELIPSPAALQYREKFAEVLIDEYQDTNFVQESILKLVTRGTEANGNLFMVGDVKQSIYRFRLAEPGLFLDKYKRFTPHGINGGMKIDLSKNFRSRSEVLDGTNFLFKQIMGESVGEIEYDEEAELKLGASYPESTQTDAEFLVINREAGVDKEDDENTDNGEYDLLDLESSQLEARLIAQKINELVAGGYEIYDRKHNTMRPVSYRDFVILLRSMPWAPQMIEEFKKYGIPAYAELTTGYFEATEVKIMLNLLHIIDNPAQDIPLTSILRSPIVGLTDEQLASVRIHMKKDSIYKTITSYLEYQSLQDDLFERLQWFMAHLDEWRSIARHQSLSELIWKLYRETGYYDFVGGLPGGKQRQANLRVLYDRARQYEATAFRGLFRFLRFIERLTDRGDDMGTAKTLGEQEDVVRIMTIHKSKGLEFPIVFVAGLSRKFNTRDINKRYLLHKDLGFGSKFVDPKKRITYTTLPQLAIGRRMKMELISEEMRVLYVALTRAKEKLYLVGTIKDANAQLEKWIEAGEHDQWVLLEHTRAQATAYIDWIGPALMRHRSSTEITSRLPQVPEEIRDYPAKWHMEIVETDTLLAAEPEEQQQSQELLETVRQQQEVSIESTYKPQVYERLMWRYAYNQATTHRAKQSVTDIKRNYQQSEDEGDTRFITPLRIPIQERPRFMERKGLTAAERGTAMHTAMQHIDYRGVITKESVQQQLAKMVNNELLTQEQAESVEAEAIVAFFASPLGKRMQDAKAVHREVPFTMMLEAKDTYQDWTGGREEVLVQGVIDCLMEEEGGMTLVDFKTDSIKRFTGGFMEAQPILEERYRKQLHLYSLAVEKSLQQKVKEKYLYFFDGGYILQIED
ncbi:helicase-exonuclease AddAB subunit AddA [Bacillus sp. 165]|uniref:helicase-exonuclease AddAB subunit AddA n=1 Tax=Bacillus sp. 165 TaxID=1529117 RepID=UPI001ADBF41F|nr:helicase-exonuclease AddAB subunit AddA [Bacillus sp. 165]MBO9128704.1 helicase-exonuclease AddAB subunit AddA [Bacillus sp. 165]